MDEVITLEIPKKEAVKLEKLMTEGFSELKRIREKGRQDQADIDRLKVETRAILAQLDNAA